MSKIILMLLLCNFSFANYYNKAKEGWHFYKKEEVKKENNQSKKNADEIFLSQIPLDNLQSLDVKTYKETFDRVKEIAVMNPSKKNLLILQRMNKWQTQRSEEFAKVWQINVAENPSLDFPEISTTKFGRSAKQTQREKQIDEFLKEKKDNLAYVVFYKTEDEYTYQKPIFDFVNKNYSIPTEYVNVKEHQEFIPRFKLANFPEIFFIYKNKKNKLIYKRVKPGFITYDELRENTIFSFENMILEKDK